MSLSYDLISEFVKITNDKKDDKKEGTVYATVVSGTEGKYVRIDGSDLLTPMDTTTDIEDGERVTLMIKDHKAIVTGNVTTPSASTSKVDKVTESVNSVSDRVGTFELVVADKVSTNELEAYKATIEVLIANKATIEDLTATNAKIENLEVKNAEIENLVAGKATIEDLEAVNATIENLKVKDAEIENAVVENLKATTADIKILNADFAQIKTLVNGNLTSDNILSFNLTSGKVTVDDAFIKDAMIDTISAGKINAGEINTNLVSIGSEDGGMLITGSTQQFTDKNGNVRIQIGKDASGDFTFVLYGEDGQGQIINQNGITASAISDGLIVNDMVSDHAAISGGKLDISSVITEINSDNSTTIKSSKIYLNEQAQSLEVAFNSLKTKVDTIQEVTIQGDLTAIVEQVQSNTSKIEANKNSINTLISEDTVIKKQVTDLQGTLNETETTLNSKYTALSQNLDGFKTTVADTYATKKSVTDVVDNIEANYSTTSVMNSAIEQKAQEISASVSSTYATKNEVSTLDNNLKTNYSTTQQMESAINVAKEEINLGVSSVYETKENTTSKIQNAVNDIQVGGTNLWVLADLTSGFENIGDINPASINHKTRQTIIPTNGARELVYQCWNPNRVENDGNTNRVAFFDSSKTFITSREVLKLNGQTYQLQIIDIPDNADYMRLGAICGPGDIYDETIKIKFELGNKPTDYSVAPEDITSDISTAKQEAITSANNTLTTTISNYYTKSQTDSQINIAKEEINLGVSSTYETKTNVETKVTSTLNSAKSYADTKKSEAISTAASDATSKANTAKQEAIISANNTLTSTIANYYTKSQTDSQINVAKEEINLGVSTIYETKESTTSKIQNAVNAVQIGGTNLWSETGWVDGAVMGDGTISDYWLRPHVYFPDFISIGNNRHITYQVWNPNGIINSDNNNRIAFYNSDKVFLSSYDIPRLNGESHQECTFEIPIESKYIRLGVISDISGGGYNDSLKFKFEFGNKATDWSPNLNDINSNINSAVNNIEVGGTNLMRNSSFQNEYNAVEHWGGNGGDFRPIDVPNALSGKGLEIGGITYQGVYQAPISSEIGTYTISFYLRTDSANPLAMFSQWEGFCDKQLFTATNSWTRCSYVVNKTRTDANNIVFYLYHGTDYNKIQIHSVQVERGNKVTDWSPSPFDTVNDIADAKNDAINSANNTLTSTISNYYTKSQTDSQINVAKEEINLGVSNLRTEVINTNFNNLLWNSDFLIEDETTNFYKGYYRTTDVCVSKGGWICPEGGKTILVDTLEYDWTWMGFTTPLIKVNRDQILTASVYVATDNIDNINPQLGIEIQWLGSDGNRISTSGYGFKPSSNYTWERVSVTGTAPEGTVSANIYCWVQHKGVAWWGKPMLQFGSTCTAWDRGGDFDNINERLSSAELKITDDSIIATVSGVYETKTTVQNKIDNIQVGGTNLWVLSDIIDGWESAGGITGTGIQHKTRQTIIPTNGARQLVYQCWNPNRVSNLGNSNRVGFFDSNQNYITYADVIQLNGETHQQQIIGIPENAAYIRLGAICGPTDFYDETIKIKFEFGNKPTDYSLAPEDVQSEFSTIESETRSIRETMTSLQLGSDSINASVKALEESMVNTTNGLASDISKVQEQVNLAMTSSDVKLEIQRELADGVKKVSTSTGFTFDENGLSINKSDSEMNTQITEDGMKIYKNNDVMLTANNQGVDAKNLHATTYLIIGGRSRMEDFTEDGYDRTAVFWIG